DHHRSERRCRHADQRFHRRAGEPAAAPRRPDRGDHVGRRRNARLRLGQFPPEPGRHPRNQLRPVAFPRGSGGDACPPDHCRPPAGGGVDRDRVRAAPLRGHGRVRHRRGTDHPVGGSKRLV
ncbi:MAG: antibiotic biosynthesis monooxygenase, partial [uncultured Thermomicrobiales bacterium]